MCRHPIYSRHQVCGRTSRGHTGGRSHRISPPSFCGACLHFSREKDSAVPFPRQPLSRILCMYCMYDHTYIVVVVDDSHVQGIALAAEETTVTQQVSHRPIKCQSRLWSQGGTKVNRSHHGDNPLLRPTEIKIAATRYAALQAMAPTNIKTVHQTSLLHIIERNLDRFGLLSLTHDQRSQQQTGQITLQPVLINTSKFLKATYCRKIRKLKYRGPCWWRP